MEAQNASIIWETQLKDIVVALINGIQLQLNNIAEQLVYDLFLFQGHYYSQVSIKNNIVQ